MAIGRYLLAGLLAMTGAPRLTMRVSPAVVMANGSVAITCLVPRDAANRSLEAAVIPYSSSVRDLDGANAPYSHRFEFAHIPCWAMAAGCRLLRQGYPDQTVQQTLLVVGCDQ